MNIVHPDFDIIYKALLGTYDLVYALNVVEHIENDILALANMKKLLKPGGYIYISAGL